MANTLSMDQAFIGKLNKILQVNLDKEHFGVKELATEIGLSRSQLHRKLKYLINKTPSRFIREFRLEKAMQMLQNNEATVSEIAYRVGFNSPTYFNTCFHDYYGYPPGEVKFRSNKNANRSGQIISTTIPRIENKVNVFSRRMIWINALAILLLSVFGFKLYQRFKDQSFVTIPMRENIEKSIAIIPFKNLSENQENQYFADGVAASILNNLSKISDIKVISSTSMEKYRGTSYTATEVGKEINVSHLLDGSVQKHGDSIRIITNLINTFNNHQITSFVFDWEYKNIFEIQSKIAMEIANELNLVLKPENFESVKKHPTENIEAYNNYLKARYFFNRMTKEDLFSSIDYYKKAVDLDSTYANAYAGLAEVYYTIAGINWGNESESFQSRGKHYLEKALALDNKNAIAHAIKGAGLMYQDWNWDAAEKELLLALKFDPNCGSAYHYYGELLSIMGRINDARVTLNLALELNPFSWKILNSSSYHYISEGKFEKAISEAQKAKEISKYKAGPSYAIITSNFFLGKEDEAFAEWEEWITLSERTEDADSEMNDKIRNAYKQSGMKGFYRVISNYLVEKDRQAADIAVFLNFLGDTNKALDYLELAFKRKEFNILSIKSHYGFKNLRAEPRFLAILDKMNLGGYDQ